MQFVLNLQCRAKAWLLSGLWSCLPGGFLHAQVGSTDSLTRYHLAFGEYKELIWEGRPAVDGGWATADIHRRMALAYRMLHNNERAVFHWKAASDMVPVSAMLASEYRQELLNCRRMDEWRWALAHTQPEVEGVLALDYAFLNIGLQNPVGSMAFRDEINQNPLALRQKETGSSTWAYAEALIQGPVTVWGGSVQATLRMPGRRGPYRISLLQSFTRFDARTYGRVQSAYWNPIAFQTSDTTIRADYVSHSTQYAQRWEAAHSRWPGWKLGGGLMVFGERSQSLSTEPYTVDSGLRAVSTPYRHNAWALSGSVSRRVTGKEYRLGLLSGTLNSQRQWQADAGLTWWPLGHQGLLVSLDLSALSNGPLSTDSLGKEMVVVGLAKVGLQLGPRFWLEIRTIQGSTLRNYTQPGTFWALNTTDQLRSVWALSGRWTPALGQANPPSNPGSNPRSNARWSLAPYIQRFVMEGSIHGLAWANPTQGTVDPNPRTVTRPYTSFFGGIALLWNPANF